MSGTGKMPTGGCVVRCVTDAAGEALSRKDRARREIAAPETLAGTPLVGAIGINGFVPN